MARMPAQLSIRIDFDAGRLGPGKIALLEHIANERSLAAAARKLDMSYKRAWELLASMNEIFDEPIAVAHPGRNVEGSTELTAFGERVIALYRAIERRCAQAATAGIEELSASSRRPASAHRSRVGAKRRA